MPVQLTINNSAPSLTVPPDRTVAQGDSLAFDITGNDADAVDPLTLTAGGLPAGLTFKDNGNRTGSVSGQVTDQPGDYTAQFSVNDSHNAPAGGNVKITVTQPLLTALIGKYERLVKKQITVGCQFVLPSVTTCQAIAIRAGKQAGTGTSTSPPGKASLDVAVPLSDAVRRAIAKSVRGVLVTVALGAKRDGNATTFTKSANTRVIAPRVRVRTPLAFKPGGARLTKAMRNFAASLAKKLASAKEIVCTGHPNRGSSSKAVAEARGKAACAALQKAGVKATAFTGKGSLRPHTRRAHLLIRR
jgi:hypothetical protein